MATKASVTKKNTAAKEAQQLGQKTTEGSSTHAAQVSVSLEEPKDPDLSARGLGNASSTATASDANAMETLGGGLQMDGGATQTVADGAAIRWLAAGSWSGFS